MTQLTGSQGISQRTSLHIAAAIVGVVAVAAIGVSFGRWVVPANDSGSGAVETTAGSVSAAAVIAEKHYELRGATFEFDDAGWAVAGVSQAPASVIAEKHYELRGATFEFDGASPPVAPGSQSPAATIAEKHYELRGATFELDEAR
jgi:hypothetical protein